MYSMGASGNITSTSITHRTVVIQSAWLQWLCPFQSNDVCCVKAAVSSHACISEIFCSICFGVPIHVTTNDLLCGDGGGNDQRGNVATEFQLTRFIAVLSENKISRVSVTSALMQAMLDEYGLVMLMGMWILLVCFNFFLTCNSNHVFVMQVSESWQLSSIRDGLVSHGRLCRS